MRIVSLLPSATEIVCALGMGDSLVGRSHECDYPLDVRELPAVTSCRINAAASSLAIHEQVTAALKPMTEPGRAAAEALSIYSVDPRKLDELQPDVILTQSQCEVCAVSEAEVAAAVAGMVSTKPRVVSVSPMRLEDVWGDIERIGAAIGAEGDAAALLRSLQHRVEDIAERAGAAERPRTVACIEWLDPLMAAGNWVPQLVAIAGGVDVLGAPGSHSQWIAFDALAAADPDVIIAMPCGFDIAQTRRSMGELTRHAGWAGLRAVKSGEVYLADGNQFFNRPGPRLVESLEILCEVLHPELFYFGHEGRGWTRAGEFKV